MLTPLILAFCSFVMFSAGLDAQHRGSTFAIFYYGLGLFAAYEAVKDARMIYRLLRG